MCRRDYQSLKADLSLGQKNRAQTDTAKLSHNILQPSTASCRWKVALRRASNPDSGR